MSVTLASQILSGFCLIPDLYAEVRYLYAKIPVFYTNICLFGFHCSGNIRGQVLICCLWSVANGSARVMH